MNHFQEIIFRSVVLTVVLISITLFPCPDITPMLGFFETAVNAFFYLDPLVDTTTAFALGGVVILIEIAYYGYRVFLFIARFITTGKLHSSDTPVYDAEGQIPRTNLPL